MTMLPCVDDWNQLTTWNVNSSSWYCLATQIFRLLMVSEGSYTAFTRGYHGVLSQAVFSPHPATVLLLHSGIILPSVSGCFEWFCPSVFPTEMFAFLCVLRAKSPAHFLLCCLFHPNNVLWKGQRSRVTRALCCMCVVCVCVCVCPCLTAPDFSFCTTLLMFTWFCVEIMPLEAAPIPNFRHPVVTTWRTLELVRWEVW